MKNIKPISAAFIILGLIVLTGAITIHSCSSSNVTSTLFKPDTLISNPEEKGVGLVFHFEKGESFNHPLMALWIEDTTGTYLQTLYVAESIAKGIYGHGDKSTGKWLPGPIRRPATLPVWAYSRGIKEDDGYYIPTVHTSLPDAVTGATPPGDFVIISHLLQDLPSVVDVYFEINQSWDWNEFWTNNKYPDDEDYKTSCQPALVYRARIDLSLPYSSTDLILIGHSHYSGKNGEIYTDLGTITTAKNITKRAWVKIEQP
jgi:hypothetical protein